MIYFQLFCTFLSLASVWLAGSVHSAAWILMLVASLSNALLYFSVQRYGHMFLDLIYFFCSVFGLALWSSTDSKATYQLSLSQGLRWGAFFILSVIFAHLVLSGLKSHDSWVDSLSLVSGIIGLVMMARKNIEQWGIWAIHDLINFALSMRAGLWIIAAKQGIYLLLAIRGYYIWKKHLSIN